MRNNILKLIRVARPISWPNTAYPFAAGYLVSGGNFDMTFLLGTLYFLIPYNLLMYGINDIFDYESDMRNPRKGGIEGAKEQKSLHPYIWWAIFLTNLPFIGWFAMNISSLAGGVLGAILFFVVAYSVKYLRFKEIPIIDSITSSLHFVGPLIFGLVLTGSVMEAAPFIVAFFLWGMASHAFGAIQDIIPDREAKLASVATVLGARFTAILSFVLYVAASLIVILQGLPVAVVGVAGLVYAYNVAPFLTITDATSYATNKGWRRFIYLNFFTGFIVTIVLIIHFL